MCSYVVKTDLNSEHVMGGKKLIYQLDLFNNF